MFGRKCFVVFVACIGSLSLLLSPNRSFSQGSESKLERIKIALPATSISFIAIRVAQLKGFFREEGLEAEMVQIRVPVSLVALTNKEIDYAAPTGTLLVAAVKGLPLKVVMYLLETPIHALVSKPEIRSVQELKGKTVSIAGVGETTGLLLKGMLTNAKLDMQKDVKTLLIPNSGNRLAGLTTGLMDAAILPPPFNLQAEASGYRRLKLAAEVPEIVEGTFGIAPPTGLGVYNEKLQVNPHQVKRVIRAVLKSQAFIRANKTDALRIISDWLKTDGPTTVGSYDLYVKTLTPDGLVKDRLLESAIEQIRQDSKIKENVPASKVTDFGLVKEALAELGMPRFGR